MQDGRVFAEPSIWQAMLLDLSHLHVCAVRQISPMAAIPICDF
jgi:hypothetical protein